MPETLPTLNKNNFQCLAAACYWIANKFVDDDVIPGKQLTYLGGGAYTLNQLVKMEIRVLQWLQYDIAQQKTVLDYLHEKYPAMSFGSVRVQKFIMDQVSQPEFLSCSPRKRAEQLLFV